MSDFQFRTYNSSNLLHLNNDNVSQKTQSQVAIAATPASSVMITVASTDTLGQSDKDA